jgi:isoleucyl-tRNA synthetase
MDTYSADALRFLFLSSPLLNGEDFSLQDKEVADINRKLAMVWNMYDFFTMYAEVDGWEWDGKLTDPSEELHNPMDQWIVSRMHELVQGVEVHMDGYDVPNAAKQILPFVEDASNWYVRRSRRRFWKSDDDADKQQAYRTLHYVLVRLSLVLAPFTPFLAEELYRKLTGGESVHLLDWMPAGHVNDAVLREMAEVRSYVTQALAIRAQSGIRVRQPLALLAVPNSGQFVDYPSILKDEVNVKQVEQGSTLELDIKLTPSLEREGVAREVIRHIQQARKAAGLEIDDRIDLVLHAVDAALSKAIEEHQAVIEAEVLAKSLSFSRTDMSYITEVHLGKATLAIGLEKAA